MRRSFPPVMYSAQLVRLQVFSGRPDPTWVISPEQMEVLAALVDTLTPSVPAPRDEAGGLGYRGFSVEHLTHPALGDSLLAVQGIVQQGQGANARWHADPHHLVELLLLQSGQAALDPALYHIVKTMLAEQGA
jgi:hypothetical protein